jgi:hypothetical protein
MIAPILRRWTVFVGLALVVSVSIAGAAEINPAAVAFKLPEQIEWKDPLGVSGAKTAVLFGDPSKPGLYVMLIKWLPGNFSRPHFHPHVFPR